MQVETNETNARAVGSCQFCRSGYTKHPTGAHIPILEIELIRPHGIPSKALVGIRVCLECADNMVAGFLVAARRVMDWKEKQDEQHR